ncbi:MAG: 5'-nucleotidase [Planctomycetota bacterium]|nr:5'-nucleotidase [Planctomycetota bacterium]MCX8039853.1 5'-nucleotidase [Planctomycetota bacterium]MDW8372816.1 5'-nucleotidase [Planctomycetota bacterium]
MPEPGAALVLAVASSALFDLSESDRVFREQGAEAYRAYQRAHEQVPLPPGAAFPFVRRVLALNAGLQPPPVELVLISRNDPDTGLRVRESMLHYGLTPGRMAFTGGADPWPYLGAFGAHLFLTRQASDVAAALAAGHAAGEVLAAAADDKEQDEQLRVAFDFDGVLADDSAERVFQAQGLAAFHAHEAARASEPVAPGPLARLLLALSRVQARLADSRRLRVAIVTARSHPADRRVIATLRAWGVRVDEAYFVGDLPKEAVLAQLRPHLFFDDKRPVADRASAVAPSVHVPFGVAGSTRSQAADAATATVSSCSGAVT